MEQITKPQPVYLYILMRTDLASMNPGKAVAQGSHAANQMAFQARRFDTVRPLLEEWERDGALETVYNRIRAENAGASFDKLTDELKKARDDFDANYKPGNSDGFGTCICLGVTERQMRAKIDAARRLGYHAGITHDPSYPLRDGDSFHLIPLDTCGFVFGRKDMVLSLLLADLDLMA